LHLTRARNLRRAGRTGEAIDEFLVSIRLRPNEPDAYAELGAVYIGLGQVEDGIKKLHEAVETDPGFPMALNVLAFYSISTGNEKDARYWLNRLVNQPRAAGEQTAQLTDAYRQTCGRNFYPDKPAN